MVLREKCLQTPAFKIALILLCCALDTAAQSPKPMELRQNRYEFRTGEPAQLSAASETLALSVPATPEPVTISRPLMLAAVTAPPASAPSTRQRGLA